MKKSRRFLALLLAGLMTMSIVTPAFAEDLLTDELNVLLEDTEVVLTEESIADDVAPAENTNDIVSEGSPATSETIDGNSFYTAEELARREYILKNDPGTIWMPVGSKPYLTEGRTDDILDDNCLPAESVSQTSVGCTWPEEQLPLAERSFVRYSVKDIVAELITDDMSELEKYWTLASWTYQNIDYKEVPSRIYALDTPHGSYCALKYGYAVCQGYGLLYSKLCHEANLPCDVISLENYGACHLINVIPDLNGHAYYVDTTNNIFLFTDNTMSPYGVLYKKTLATDPAVVYDCLDNSFTIPTNGYYSSVPIVCDSWKTYNDFYHVFVARDSDLNMSFGNEYVEKGSAIPGQHTVNYESYALNDTRNTGEWIYDDFSDVPKELKQKEANLLIPEKPVTHDIADAVVTGVKEIYDLDSDDDYLAALREDAVLTYGETVLTRNDDYFMDYVYTNWDKGYVKVAGTGSYSGFKSIPFNIDVHLSTPVNPSTPDPNTPTTPTTPTTPDPQPKQKEQNTTWITMTEGTSLVLDYLMLSDMVTSFDTARNEISKDGVANFVVARQNGKDYVELQAVKPGTASTVVETSDIVYTLNVTVEKDNIPEPQPIVDEPEKPKTEEGTVKLVVGGKLTDSAYAKTAADGKNYRISYSATNIATLSDKGVLQGKKPGSTVITITRPDSVTKLNVTVINPAFSAKTFVKNAGDEFDTGLRTDEIETYYVSSRPDIATVDGTGHVKAVAKGTAKITASVQGKKYSTTVKVYDPEITGVNDVYLNNKKITLKIKNGNGKTQWSSSNESIAKVDKSGKVLGIAEGKVVITAVNNGRTMTHEVGVFRVPRFLQKKYIINDGDTVERIFDNVGVETTYTSSKPDVVEVSADGTIKGLKKGSSKITALCGSKKYSVSVSVFAPEMVVSKDWLLTDNKTITLKVKNGTGKTEWSSSDSGVVSVTTGGKIKGLSRGTATITAKNNGRTMTQTIKVYTQPSFEKSYEVNVGKDTKVVLAKDADMENPVYTSSNVSVATVDESGKVTGIKKGNVTITATVMGKKYKTTVKVVE